MKESINTLKDTVYSNNDITQEYDEDYIKMEEFNNNKNTIEENKNTDIKSLSTNKNFSESVQSTKIKDNFDIRHRIDILKKEQKNLKDKINKIAIQQQSTKSLFNNKRLIIKQREEFKPKYKEEYLDILEDKVIDEYDNMNITYNHNEVDTFGLYVDRILHNSITYYINRPCTNCSKLLSSGKNTLLCKRNHHKLK